MAKKESVHYLQVKGIKVKEKIVPATAVRPPNALEKINQKKRPRSATSIPQNTSIGYQPILNGQSLTFR
ncbi:hypothetical protein C5167_027023 [Papaver somniferum]|nr:hypothetical protein C5167_027023 [Papaver somniferum]